MNTPGDAGEGGLRLLRRLVTALTLVMIVGIVITVGVFVVRFPQLGERPQLRDLPSEIVLPEGLQPLAFTQAPTWYAIASEDEIAIFDRETGVLMQRIRIRPPQ